MKLKYPHPRGGKWDFMHWYDIPSRVHPDEVYLRRLRAIQTPWFSVLFHKIYEPDDGLYPHDHPWSWFRTFILRGGYLSDEYKDYQTFRNDQVKHTIHRPLSTYLMRYTQGHQIMLVRPNTWTLVVTGKRIRTFCFWTPKGKIPYNKMGEINDVE